jgi:hypothetical protein
MSPRVRSLLDRYRKWWPFSVAIALLIALTQLGITHQRVAIALAPLLAPLFTVTSLLACIVHLLNLREVYLDREVLFRTHLDGAMREAANFIVRNERVRLLKSLILLTVGLNVMLGFRVGIYFLLLIPPISLVASAIDLRERRNVR